MRRRVLYVTLDGYGSLVGGHGSRELVISVTGRPPLWSSHRRGWVAQEHTARDVIAAAELRGYDVVITSASSAALTTVQHVEDWSRGGVVCASGDEAQPTPPREQSAPGGELW